MSGDGGNGRPGWDAAAGYKPAALKAGLIAALAGWLLGWIFALGPVLISDEYAAIDYFYRIVRGGGFYPTPFKLHKPLSVLMGSAAWLFESPLGYEAAVAAFAVIFIIFLYLSLRHGLGPWPAAIGTGAVAVHPELMYYTATGSTIIPFCALAMVGLYAALRRDEGERWRWLYAGAFCVAGLTRPEAWLFAAPVVVWWWPGRDKRGWVRLVLAGVIIGLAPAIWLGADWLINGSLLHGMQVAVRDKAVGTGAPLSVYEVTRLFWVRVPEGLSRPVGIAGLVGLGLFVRRRGWRGLLHPYVAFPAIVSAYVWLIVYKGVWHAQRYWYFDEVFITAFAAWLLVEGARAIRLTRAAIARYALFFAALFFGAGLLVVRPEGDPADGWWLLGAGACGCLAAMALIMWPELFFQGLGSLAVEGARLAGRRLRREAGSRLGVEARQWGRLTWERVGLAALVAAGVVVIESWVAVSGVNYQRKTAELTEEARKQAEMARAGTALREAIAPGGPERVLLPARRNEQLDWIFRDRELPDAFFFREAFYLNYHRGIDFLELHPDWVLYLPHDYQFRGPAEMFDWLGHQDHATLHEIKIDLVTDYGTLRMFKVTYPPGHPGKQPLPPIPCSGCDSNSSKQGGDHDFER
jgi:hypothetical protein